MLKVVWRGQAVFVVRRVKGIIAQLGDHDALLADPASDDSLQPDYIKATGAARARNPEYWVGLAVCTHLGLLSLGRIRGEQFISGGGRRFGRQLAGRLLLSLPWVQIRFCRAGYSRACRHPRT